MSFRIESRRWVHPLFAANIDDDGKIHAKGSELTDFISNGISSGKMAARPWTSENNTTLLRLMRDYRRMQFDQIEHIDWRQLSMLYNHMTGMDVSFKTLKHRMEYNKKQWRLWLSLRRAGIQFEWDPQSGTVLGYDLWWEQAIQIGGEHCKSLRRFDVDLKTVRLWEEVFTPRPGAYLAMDHQAGPAEVDDAGPKPDSDSD